MAVVAANGRYRVIIFLVPFVVLGVGLFDWSSGVQLPFLLFGYTDYIMYYLLRIEFFLRFYLFFANYLNGNSLKWQRYAVSDGVIKVKNIYALANEGEGVLLANISAYNTPSITEQYLYIIGFSANRGDANFHKIVGDGETISSVTCTGNLIVLNLTSDYSSAICRVLFIGN